jgi:hypothetical protein
MMILYLESFSSFHSIKISSKFTISPYYTTKVVGLKRTVPITVRIYKQHLKTVFIFLIPEGKATGERKGGSENGTWQRL